MTSDNLQLSQPSWESALIYFIDQDGTCGRAITWGAGFGYASASLGNALPNIRSVSHFTLTGGLYTMSSQPPADLAQ